MSTLVNEALPTVVYGETGQGKTTDIMAAAALAADQTGVVLTPKRSNLTSVERTLGLYRQLLRHQPCNYLSMCSTSFELRAQLQCHCRG